MPEVDAEGKHPGDAQRRARERPGEKPCAWPPTLRRQRRTVAPATAKIPAPQCDAVGAPSRTRGKPSATTKEAPRPPTTATTRPREGSCAPRRGGGTEQQPVGVRVGVPKYTQPVSEASSAMATAGDSPASIAVTGDAVEAAGEQEQQHEEQRPQHVELRLDRRDSTGGAAATALRSDRSTPRLRERTTSSPPTRAMRAASPRSVRYLKRAVVDRGEDRASPARTTSVAGRSRHAGPPAPELRQVTAAFCASIRRTIRRRDEEAGEDEEHVDAQPTARQPRTARVEHHDREHRDAAQPVERGVP